MSARAQLFGSIKDFANQSSPPGMLEDLFRMTIQKIISDKILLGLVIIAFCGIFVGSFSSKKDERPAVKAIETLPVVPQLAKDKSAVPSGYSNNAALEPALATDFAKWWVSGAFDYSNISAAKSHSIALTWMTPTAQKSLTDTFWTPQLANAIAQRSIVGGFQPSTIQAEAINPDGTVVVGLSGTLVMQSGGRPVSQPILLDILVRKEPSGLRIAGLYNRSTPPLTSSAY
jgi:hypothetical protein